MNKYFKVTDKKIYELGNMTIPETWWSRPYEYAFCLDFLNENDVILDVGCGIEHPFKFEAAKRVKEVHAIDTHKAVGEIKQNVYSFKNIDMRDLEAHYEFKKFDKVFIISVLEHVRQDALNCLKQAAKVLKDDGKIVLTLDCPTLEPKRLKEVVKEAGLEFVGDVDYKKTDEDIYSKTYNLNCYSAVLRKKKESFLDRKKKVDKPSTLKKG